MVGFRLHASCSSRDWQLTWSGQGESHMGCGCILWAYVFPCGRPCQSGETPSVESLDGCGITRFSADPQVGATSPLLLAFAILSPNPLRGFVVYWVAIWIFGGLGMLLLCRHLKCPAWGALIAALGFVSCGFYTGHGEHTTTLYSFSFLPWVIWRFDVALRHRSYRNRCRPVSSGACPL